MPDFIDRGSSDGAWQDFIINRNVTTVDNFYFTESWELKWLKENSERPEAQLLILINMLYGDIVKILKDDNLYYSILKHSESNRQKWENMPDEDEYAGMP